MTSLNVPYFPQAFAGACGVAAFEMVYRYFRPSKLSKFNPTKLFGKKAEPDPHGGHAPRIKSDDLVAAATGRGFSSGWGAIDPVKVGEQLEFFLTRGIPLIVCQRYKPDDPTTGHFRVVIGFDGNTVTYHDPCPDIGGEAVQKSVAAFVEMWEPSGENVTGGIAIWVSPEPPDNVPLAVSGSPHLWMDDFGRRAILFPNLVVGRLS